MTQELPDTSFMVDGLCRDYDGSLWFADTGSLESHQAKVICRKCPVKDECGEYGLKHESFGIYGGMSPNERRAARRGKHQLAVPHSTWNDRCRTEERHTQTRKRKVS